MGTGPGTELAEFIFVGCEVLGILFSYFSLSTGLARAYLAN